MFLSPALLIGTALEGGEGDSWMQRFGGRWLVKQNVYERGRFEGCFAFTSWLVGAFDLL